MSAATIVRKVYKKPKQRKRESAERVKRLRIALGLNQVDFAARLSRMAMADHSANLTSIYAVRAWEGARREPDPIRLRLIERLERQVRERDGKDTQPGAPLAGAVPAGSRGSTGD